MTKRSVRGGREVATLSVSSVRGIPHGRRVTRRRPAKAAGRNRYASIASAPADDLAMDAVDAWMLAGGAVGHQQRQEVFVARMRALRLRRQLLPADERRIVVGGEPLGQPLREPCDVGQVAPADRARASSSRAGCASHGRNRRSGRRGRTAGRARAPAPRGARRRAPAAPRAERPERRPAGTCASAAPTRRDRARGSRRRRR